MALRLMGGPPPYRNEDLNLELVDVSWIPKMTAVLVAAFKKRCVAHDDLLSFRAGLSSEPYHPKSRFQAPWQRSAFASKMETGNQGICWESKTNDNNRRSLTAKTLEPLKYLCPI